MQGKHCFFLLENKCLHKKALYLVLKKQIMASRLNHQWTEYKTGILYQHQGIHLYLLLQECIFHLRFLQFLHLQMILFPLLCTSGMKNSRCSQIQVYLILLPFQILYRSKAASEQGCVHVLQDKVIFLYLKYFPYYLL